jgi:diaminohydroxyphosphoribosylaminopyrimidine deaminase/5-amino-6-(5-phosphoribosylamino)uracil reductase
MSADMTANADDERWMRAALSLARRGLGRTWPNPTVGCVIVQDGVVKGQGWTQPDGRPHAETEALAMAGEGARGATAYVTLEPCSHYGRTPPCASALVEAGVTRAVIAIGDPDPRVAGGGIAMLRAGQVEVVEGVLADDARRVNAGFLKRLQEGLPLVTLKLATTLDGKIATVTGGSQWITGPEARRYGHYLRAINDAIMVGRGTAQADNPSLTCRLLGLEDRSPVRVFVDTKGRLPASLSLMSGHGPATWRLSGPGAAAVPDTVKNLEVRLDADGVVDPKAAFQALAAEGITRLLVEGGGTLAGSLIKAGLVDEIAWFRAPYLIGNDGFSGIAPLGVERIADMHGFSLVESRQLGDDVLSTYRKRDT